MPSDALCAVRFWPHCRWFASCDMVQDAEKLESVYTPCALSAGPSTAPAVRDLMLLRVKGDSMIDGTSAIGDIALIENRTGSGTMENRYVALV